MKKDNTGKKKKPKLSKLYIIDMAPQGYEINKAMDSAVEDEDYEHASFCKKLLDIIYKHEGGNWHVMNDELLTTIKQYNNESC